MDINWEAILLNHFLWGLVIGVVMVVFVMLKGFFKVREVRKEKNVRIRDLENEVIKLRQHLETQREIETEATENRNQTIETLKKENENLRLSLQTLRQKPEREEILLLHTYDKALHLMQERAPGFAASWELALKEAQEEINKMEKGIIPFIKRVINPSHWLTRKSSGNGSGTESTATQDGPTDIKAE